ncbi:MAG: hypothetical protein BWY91_01763 [bacterium ADurb.BinA028]|nr:MAG: hypothetical protein BWY91_01763 [bacterium ADurb.BinA028]
MRIAETLVVTGPVEGDEHRHHSPGDRLPDPDGRRQTSLQRPLEADGCELIEMVSAGENASGSSEDEVVLALEDPEDGPLGNPGGRGEILRGHVETTLEDERHGCVDERGPASLGGQRRGSGRLGQGFHHSGTISE